MGRMKYLKHFMYIHFREAKLEVVKRSIINSASFNIHPNLNNVEHLNKALCQLLDRQLLNQDFKWINELKSYSQSIAEKIKTLSYPVFGEPPFSFRLFNQHRTDSSNQSQSQSNGQHPIIDNNDAKYVEPINRVSQMVNDAKSIKVICQMPPSWNPFF